METILHKLTHWSRIDALPVLCAAAECLNKYHSDNHETEYSGHEISTIWNRCAVKFGWNILMKRQHVLSHGPRR